MDSRERTFLVLSRRPADRLPFDFWASAAMWRKLQDRLGLAREAFLDRHDVDLRYLDGPAYAGPPLGEGEDLWGVRRRTVALPAAQGGETYEEVEASPLARAETVEQILAYPRWPSPDWFDYSVVSAQCRRIRDRGRVAVFMGDRLNRVAQLKPAMYLRGTEQIFLDMALNEDLAAAVFAGIRAFYLGYLDRILGAAGGLIDVVLTGDDFGSQAGLLVSPDMWRRFLGPGFAEYVGLAKQAGARVMHHTCGAVGPLIPDLIDCGLDILQSLQPEAAGMSLPDLAARFGRRLCFHGGVSIQRTMPFATPAAVRADVEGIARVMKPGGGYIFCTAHNIQADTPVENVLALLDAYLEHGRY